MTEFPHLNSQILKTYVGYKSCIILSQWFPKLGWTKLINYSISQFMTTKSSKKFLVSIIDAHSHLSNQLYHSLWLRDNHNLLVEVVMDRIE